jgi:hypothetical protein
VMGKDDIIIGNKIDGEVGSDLKFYGHNFHVVGKRSDGYDGCRYGSFHTDR